jgi:hypothetical protein
MSVSGKAIDLLAQSRWLQALALLHQRIAARDAASARSLLVNLRSAGVGQSGIAALQAYLQQGETLATLQPLADAIALIGDSKWAPWLRLLDPLSQLPPATLLSLPFDKQLPAAAAGPLQFSLEASAQLDIELNAASPTASTAGPLIRLGADGSFSINSGASVPWVYGAFGGTVGGSTTDQATLEFDLWMPGNSGDPALLGVANAVTHLCNPFDLTAIRDLPTNSSLRLAGKGSLEVEIDANAALLTAAGAVKTVALDYKASKQIDGSLSIEIACLGQRSVRISAYRSRGELTTQALKASVGLSLSGLVDKLGEQLAGTLTPLTGGLDKASIGTLQRPGGRLLNALKKVIDAHRGDATTGRWITAIEQRLQSRTGGNLSSYLASILDAGPDLWQPDVSRATQQALDRIDGLLNSVGGLPDSLKADLNSALSKGIADLQGTLQDAIGKLGNEALQQLQQRLGATDAKAGSVFQALLNTLQQGRAKLTQALDWLHSAADAAIELRIEHGSQRGNSREACIVVEIDARAITGDDDALVQAWQAAFVGNFIPLQRLATNGDNRVLNISGSLREVLTRQDQTRIALSLLNTALLDEALYDSQTTITRAFDGSVELLSRASFERRRALFGEAQIVRCVNVFALIAAQSGNDVKVALTVSQQDQHFDAGEFRSFVTPLEQAALLASGTAQRVAALLSDPRGPALFGHGAITASLELGLQQLNKLFTATDSTIATTAARHLVDKVYRDTVGVIQPPLSKLPSWSGDASQNALTLAARYRSYNEFDPLVQQICQIDGTGNPALPRYYTAFLRQLWNAGRSANALCAFLGILRNVSQSTLTAQQCEDQQFQASQNLGSWMQPSWVEVAESQPAARFVALLQTLAELASTGDSSVLQVALWFSADDQHTQLLA